MMIAADSKNSSWRNFSAVMEHESSDTASMKTPMHRAQKRPSDFAQFQQGRMTDFEAR